jgi:hypothetical protein
MPETMVFDRLSLTEAERFFERQGKVVVKRRVGRGGRGLRIISDLGTLRGLDLGPNRNLLQEYIESKIDGYTLSIRSIAFGGEFMCIVTNLSQRSTSNHGVLIFTSSGDTFGLGKRNFDIESFNKRSWEAEIWFGENDPSYLRHNLYEEEVAKTILYLPGDIHRMIQERSVQIERFYESLDLYRLPKACFEE